MGQIRAKTIHSDEVSVSVYLTFSFLFLILFFPSCYNYRVVGHMFHQKTSKLGFLTLYFQMIFLITNVTNYRSLLGFRKAE